MRSPTRSRPLSLLLALAACGDASPEAPRIEIIPYFEGPICAGNLPHLEERLEWLEATLGLTVEGPIRYHWAEGEHGFCPSGAGGCAQDGEMWGPWGSVDHELVHIVLGTLGRPTSFLSEGAAVAFTQEFLLLTDRSQLSRWLDCDFFKIGEFDGPLCYERAGHFVRYLIERHGIEPFKQLYELSDHGDGADAFIADFERVYGRKFIEFEVEYVYSAYDVYPGLAGCGRPAIAWDGGAYSGEFLVDCDDPDVLRVDEKTIQRRVHFELSAPTNGRFRVDGEARFASNCPREPFHVDAQPSPETALAAGTYTLYLDGALDGAETRPVTFEPD